MICNKCGTQNSMGISLCVNCGNPLELPAYNQTNLNLSKTSNDMLTRQPKITDLGHNREINNSHISNDVNQSPKFTSLKQAINSQNVNLRSEQPKTTKLAQSKPVNNNQNINNVNEQTQFKSLTQAMNSKNISERQLNLNNVVENNNPMNRNQNVTVNPVENSQSVVNDSVELNNPVENKELNNNPQYNDLNQVNNNNKENEGGIRKAIKRMAKPKAKKLIGFEIITSLIILLAIAGLIYSITSKSMEIIAISVLGLLCFVNIFSYIYDYGITNMALNVLRGNDVSVGKTFVKSFKNFKHILILIFVEMIYGIIFSIVWSISITGSLVALVLMIYFMPVLQMMLCLYADEKYPKESFSKMHFNASDLIKGHRLEYYATILSLGGWMLLGIFTFGLLYIWLKPYIKLTIVGMYSRWLGEAKYELNEKGISNLTIIVVWLIIFIISFVISIMSKSAITSLGIYNIIKDDEPLVNEPYNDVGSYENPVYDYTEKEDKNSTLNLGGVEIYIPNDFTKTTSKDYDYFYMNSENDTIGVKSINSTLSSLQFANEHYQIMSKNFTCSKPISSSATNYWATYSCGSTKMYFEASGNVVYMVMINSNDTELISTIEKTIKLR